MSKRITWQQIQDEYKRLTGSDPRPEIVKMWKRIGKSWAVRCIHGIAKESNQETALPFYYRDPDHVTTKRMVGGQETMTDEWFGG